MYDTGDSVAVLMRAVNDGKEAMYNDTILDGSADTDNYADLTAFGGVHHTPPIPRNVSAAIRVLLDRLDRAERRHASDVSFYAMMICESLELPVAFMRKVVCGALLHDVGKVAIPVAERIHPGELTPYERLNMLTHPEIGEAMVSVHPTLAPYAGIVRHHHERYDGKGYPDGLAGGAFPVAPAIVAMAEAFTTMITDQPYRPARPWHDAVAEIRRGSGTQFHPTVAEGFLIALGEEPTTVLH